MSNYIHNIDNNAMKLAETAYEIGDYQCAYDNYTKTLNRLRNYTAHSLDVDSKANELAKKINELEPQLSSGKSILTFDDWILTKSSFVKGKQCVKYLFLDKHKKQEKTPISAAKQKIFNYGHAFEELVRKNEFPDGINIKDKIGNFAYFNSYTTYLINIASTKIMYEASIIEEQVLVMCDILVKHENGDIHIYEIKLNSDVNEAIIADLAIQYTICKLRFGSALKSFNLILRTDDLNKQWKIQNLTDDVEKQMDAVKTTIHEYKTILQQNEPNLAMGEQCNKPYECEFIDYCKKNR